MSTSQRPQLTTLGILDEQPATQCRTALMRAHDAGLLNYVMPINTDEERDIATLRRYFGDHITDDAGHFYLILINVDGENAPLLTEDSDVKLTPMLLAEREVLPFVYALYLTRLPERAHDVSYRHGMLSPLPPPPPN